MDCYRQDTRLLSSKVSLPKGKAYQSKITKNCKWNLQTLKQRLDLSRPTVIATSCTTSLRTTRQCKKW